MGIWDVICNTPLDDITTPTTLPKRETTVVCVDGETRQNPRKATIGQMLDDAKNTLKFIINVHRRVVSLFGDEESRKLKKGDIIGICRGAYDHYGVYESDECVIHYSSKDSDTSSDNSIIITSLEEFARGDGTIFKLLFPDEYGKPSMIVAKPQAASFRQVERQYEKLKEVPDYKLYSPDETVERAKSRLGEREYSLINNNCEHFAIWCKTGISESHQINALLEAQRKLFEATIYT